MEVYSTQPLTIDQIRRSKVEFDAYHRLVSSLLVGSAIYDADLVLGRCLPAALPRYLSESIWEPETILDRALRSPHRDHATEARPLD